MKAQSIYQAFEAVQLVLIIVYCALSQSICSTVALATFLIDVTLILNKFYVEKKEQTSIYQPLRTSDHKKQFAPIQLRRYLWIAFFVINLLWLILKSLYFIFGKPQMSDDLKVAFEVQNYIVAYVPTLLLAVGAPLVMIKDQNKKIMKFIKPTDQAFILPVYMLLVVLLVLIQIFNTSILGLLIVFVLMILVGRRKWSFVEGRVEISIIQIVIGIYIILAFLSSMSLIPFFPTIQFWGLQCLKPDQFELASNKAYFFSLILAFLLANFINSMFGYEKMHSIIKKNQITLLQAAIIEEQDESDIPDDAGSRQKYKAMKNIKRYERDIKRSLVSEVEMENFSDRASSFIKEPVEIIQSQKIPQTKDVFIVPQAQIVSDTNSSNSSQNVSKFFESKRSRFLYRQERINSKNMKRRNGSNTSSVIQSQKRRKLQQIVVQQQPKETCLSKFSGILRNIFQFLTSIPLNFRVTQLLSVIVIQRYNTIYSLVLIVWLIVSSIVTRALFLRNSIKFIVLPLAIANYITCFLYNIPQNPIQNIQCGKVSCSIYGFQEFNKFFWDIIIFDIYLFFILNFIKYSNFQDLTNMVYQDKLVQAAHRARPNSQVPYWLIFVAFLFKYTHIITLILLYWVGFDAPNLLHLVLIFMFLIFYAFGSSLRMITKVNQDGKTKQVFTTFTQSYWFLIVIFIGITIMFKYVYFLFFANFDADWIDPIGIAEVYDVPFNFSMKECRSNTTPLFWIFILSVAQLAITHSTIYIQYSFSILAVLSQKSGFINHSKKINYFITLITSMYYKCLFAMSAIISLICDFRWSINGIIIGAFTSFGLLFGFGQGKLWIYVMWVNILHIFLNYFVMFFAYPAVVSMFGEDVANSIVKYSSMLGAFQVTSEKLHSLFLESIIIFILSVECTQLYNRLIEADSDEAHVSEAHIIPLNDPVAEVTNIVQKADNIELNQELDDNEVEYANKMKKQRIRTLKNLWNMDLFVQYIILQKLWKVFQFFFLDISLLFVILCSLYFRLSVSMLVFLVIYLTYYFIAFHELHRVYESYQFYDHLDQHMDRLDNKIKQIYQQKNEHIYSKSQDFDEFKQTFDLVKESMEETKMKYKKYLWLASSVVTLFCIILTYSSQFFISDYCNNYCPNAKDAPAIFYIRKILFIIGVSTDDRYSLWRSIYFYFFMVMINMIQRCANTFKMNAQQRKNNEQISKVLISRRLPNFNHEIDNAIEEGYRMESMEEINEDQSDIQTEIFHPIQWKNNLQKTRWREPTHGYPDAIKNVNLVCFFKINAANIKIKMLFGVLSAMLRLYILMLLLNSYAKSNIFSWVYLIVALIYWNLRIKFQLVENINKIAIVILLIQYTLLLFNINPFDSPYYQYQFEPYTIAGKGIHNPEWLSYLAFGGNTSKQFKTTTSFIINSLIIFATEYYFRVFALVCEYTISSFIKIKNFYQYTLNHFEDLKMGETVFINTKTFKSRSYIVLSKVYQLCTVNSFLFLSTMILLIIDGFNTTLSILLLLISSVYFYLAMFSKSGDDEKIVDRYTYKYFMFYKVITFIQFVIVTIFNLPPLVQSCAETPSDTFLKLVCNEVQVLSVFGQLVLLYFVQLWLDLESCKQFSRFSKIYYKTSYNKQIIMARCHTYAINDKKFSELFSNYQMVLNFQLEVQKALKSLEEWYIIMKKEEEYHSLRKEEFSYFFKQKSDISQKLVKQLKQDKKFMDILKSQINHTLYTSSADLVMELRFHNSRILQDLEVNFSQYVLDKLDNAIQKIMQLDEYNDSLYVEIIQSNQYKKIIKEEIEGLGICQSEPTSIIIPPILDLKIQKQELSKVQIVIFYILSKFDYVLTLSILIYYLVNPALFSLPIVILMFGFQIISEYKVKNFVLLYILLLVVFLQIIDQVLMIKGQPIPDWLSYLFADAQQSEQLSSGYLNFLFIMILINQIIKKGTGLHRVYPVQQQNQYQALLRQIIDYYSPQSPSLHNVLEQNHQASLVNINISSVTKMQDEMNPYVLYSEKLQQNSNLIADNRIPSFFSSFYINKPGADLYPYIASVQIFITIYLIFFYPIMLNKSGIDLDQTLVYNSFSADMIILLLIHVTSIIVERWITLSQYKQGKKELIKYIETMILLFLVCIFVYWYAPSGGGITTDYSYSSPPALKVFMFIQMIYFSLSTLQISYGYQKFKRINSLLHKRNMTNDVILNVFTSIPYLQQLKILMDWAFAKTSLTLSGWSKHFNIYLMSFQAQMTAVGIRQQKLGIQAPKWSKILFGWCGFMLILLLIFGPMIIFSGLNPASEPNLVVGGSLELGITIVGGNYFQFYSTSHFSTSPSIVNSSTFYEMGFNKVPALQALKQSQLKDQFQYVNYFPYSDNFWQISTPNFQYLNETISQTLISMKNGSVPQYQFTMNANYELNRNISDTVSTPSSFSYPFLNSSSVLNQSQLISLNKTINECDTPTLLPNFYISLLRLDTTGSTYKARPISYYNGSSKIIPQFTQTVSLQLKCTFSPDGSTASASGLYWSVTIPNNQGQQQGLLLYVLCDKYQKLSFGLSFIGLYTSVILVVASFIRKFFTGQISLIPYNMNPRPEYILSICEAIYIMRMRGNLRAQYVLYYQLIDIMRSPEIIKFMCGSFTKIIREEDKMRKKQLGNQKMIKND